MVINQGYLFLIFILNGILIGFLFDFFRILRKCFKTSNLITYIEDFIFWILTGISIIFFMYRFSDGNLRFYIFIGLGLGCLIYILLLSKIVTKIFMFIIKIIRKIINLIYIPLKFIYNLINKFLIKKIQLLYIKMRNYLTKNIKKINYKEKFKNFCKKS